MKKMSLLEMEVQTGGDVGFFDGLACGIGIGLLVSGVGSIVGWAITGYGCARALDLI